MCFQRLTAAPEAPAWQRPCKCQDHGERRPAARASSRKPDGLLQHQILDHLYDGLYVVDQERKIVYWNPAAARLTGYTSEQMVGRHCFDNLLNHVDAAGCSLCQGRCPLVATMGDGDAREALVYLRHQSGSRLPVEVRASALRDAAGKIVGAVEAFQDGRKRENLGRRLEELEKLAEIDALTQVANRRSLSTASSLTRAMDFSAGRRGLSVLILDVDRFKQVNDTYGHPGGRPRAADYRAHTDIRRSRGRPRGPDWRRGVRRDHGDGEPGRTGLAWPSASEP